MSKRKNPKSSKISKFKGKQHQQSDKAADSSTSEISIPISQNSIQKTKDSLTSSSAQKSPPLQPEQMSLEAYGHIQECLKGGKQYLDKEDVTAVVQLAQHLRVFGLLSAVGYVRHARDGKIRDRIRPMWTPLLWRLVCGSKAIPADETTARQILMDATHTLSKENPKGYMVIWRRSLKLSNHWNFWARACQVEEKGENADEQRTENGNVAG